MYKIVNLYVKKEFINIKKYAFRNKRYVLLNRSIFIGIIAAVLVSALSSHLMKDLEPHLNTSYTIIVSYLTYYTVFALLYFNDNKKEYLIENKKLDIKKFRKDIIKIVFSVGIAELIYVTTRWSIHFYLLIIGNEPYITSITAHISSAIIFAIVVNIGVRATSLFNKKN